MSESESKPVELTINQGTLCGIGNETPNGTRYTFNKIPYAQPPLGALRFLVSFFK